MPEPPVVNASPLIILAHGGAFDLLRVAGDQLVVPSAVAVEIRQRGPTDVTVQMYLSDAVMNAALKKVGE